MIPAATELSEVKIDKERPGSPTRKSPLGGWTWEQRVAPVSARAIRSKGGLRFTAAWRARAGGNRTGIRKGGDLGVVKNFIIC